MGAKLLLTPLSYLRLVDERGVRLVFRDLIATLLLAMLLALPFLVFQQSNYFHKDGFVDKIGTFSSVLTGFYVAGLLAVATFAASLGDLDSKIEVGSIILPASSEDEDDLHLTRREYVCYIFGYLAFGSLALTVASIIVVAVASSLPPMIDHAVEVGGYTIFIGRAAPRIIAVGFYSLILAHVISVTCHGLYYLIDRLYARAPRTLPERNQETDDSAH